MAWIDVDLRQVIFALADALDLVGVDDVAHGKRVGLMAARCCQAMSNLPPEEPARMFELGVLHDIGVSRTSVHRHLVEEFDWAGSQEHADIGYLLLRDFPPLAWMADAVRYHHTHWEALEQLDLDPVNARRANLIYLVDRVDALSAGHYESGEILVHRKDIRDQIARRRRTHFAPALVDAFLEASAHEDFWLMLEPRALPGFVAEIQSAAPVYQASLAELRQLAEIFARIVDAKSSFTHMHSRGVARVAKRLGQLLKLPQAQCDKLEIAGLLHDLGKLRVPDEILEKPGPLDERERAIMNAHSFETLQILRRIQGIEDITDWAANHHEAPHGRGYPRGLEQEQLPIESRILRVADIFQAMVQNRPYRQGLSPRQVREFMADLLAKEQVRPDIMQVLQTNLRDLYLLASVDPGPSHHPIRPR